MLRNVLSGLVIVVGIGAGTTTFLALKGEEAVVLADAVIILITAIVSGGLGVVIGRLTAETE